jgi:hypothetical protein
MGILGAGLMLFAIGFGGLVAVGLLIYVIVNRIRQIDKENFPDRKN